MPYTVLLNDLIKKSGMSAKEIAEKCQALGASITPSYLSLLRKENCTRTPSEDISRALAKVLGADDEDLLLVEKALDDAPEAIRRAFQNLVASMTAALMQNASQELDADTQNRMMEIVMQQPLAQAVLQLARQPDLEKIHREVNTAIIQNETGTTVVNVSGFTSFDITDNAMYPTLTKGDKVNVTAQAEYATGDIIAVIGKEDTLQYRQLQKVGNTALLVAFNSEYAPQAFEADCMTIFGKVNAVITLF